MNYKKLLTFFATFIFLYSVAPTLVVHAKEETEVTDSKEVNETIDKVETEYDVTEKGNETISSIKVEEKQFWEVEISEDLTLEGFDTSGFEYKSENGIMPTLDVIDKASNDNIRKHLLAITKEYELPEECPSDLCISYSVESNGKIVDVKIDYTEVEEIEDKEEASEIMSEPLEEYNESSDAVEADTESTEEVTSDEVDASNTNEVSEEVSNDEDSDVADSNVADSNVADPDVASSDIADSDVTASEEADDISDDESSPES